MKASSNGPLRSYTRRDFIKGMGVGAGLLASETYGNQELSRRIFGKRSYGGPNVIVVRFGGGVRRRETIEAEHTYAPYLVHGLAPRGTLFKNMEIDFLEGVETSHGQGTLYIISGKYDRFKDIGGKFLGQRFESKVPTIFEYFRKTYDIPSHEAIIINGEDRTDEEFYSFSNHHLFGAHFRSSVLSLYRFKTFLLRRKIEGGDWEGEELQKKQMELVDLEALDYRTEGNDRQSGKIDRFWERWRRYYGESGLVNPRGDRLLTELSVRALRELHPKLMMVNYNDPDYVHWGNMTHYTRGIAIIDEGIRQLVATTEAIPEYRGNTVFIIVPDCGRDSSPFAAVPFQHHFNSRSAHEIWALVVGPGMARETVVDKRVDQTEVAATVGKIMEFGAEFAEGGVLGEAFA